MSAFNQNSFSEATEVGHLEAKFLHFGHVNTFHFLHYLILTIIIITIVIISVPFCGQHHLHHLLLTLLTFYAVVGTNIAEQLDAANMVQMASPQMASPPPSAGPTPLSPVSTLPSPHPELYNAGLVAHSMIPGASVSTPTPVHMVQDSRPFVPGPPTSLPGGIVPKTERFDT